jgi:hypothetical protein
LKEYAASYYLLSDQIEDCVDILINKAKNYHLAYLIVRVFSGDESEIAQKILRNYILLDAQKNLYDEWFISVIRWNLREYEESLESLIVSNLKCLFF